MPLPCHCRRRHRRRTLAAQLAAHPLQLLAAFRPLAEHVRANEEGTITYQWLQSDSDPLKCLILERCVSGTWMEALLLLGCCCWAGLPFWAVCLQEF